MAAANTSSTLSGLFKETYADKLLQLVPASRKLIRAINFVQGDLMPGNKYHQPVLMTQEHGFSYSAAGAGIITLNAAIAAQLQDAQIDGSQMWIKSQIDNEAAAKASSEGPRAFVKATKLLVENMMVSITKRLEHQLLYGQQGLGVISSVTNGGATPCTITITDASWCPALWAGSEGAQIDVLSGTTVSSSTFRNYSGTAVTPLTIGTVSLANKTVAVTGTCTGTITAADTLFWTSACSGTAAGPPVLSTFNEMAGLDKIVNNAGTLFNISASTYNLWAGTVISSTGSISFGKIMNGVARAVERGLEEKVSVLMSPRCYQALNADLTGARIFDSSYKSNEMAAGASSLKFYGMNGEVEVMPHLFVRDGDLFVVNTDDCIRIGATDVTFNRPGKGGEIFFDLPTQNGYEFRAYSHQSLFCNKPAHLVKLSGITYT